MSAIAAQHLHAVKKINTVDEWLDNVKYDNDPNYIPSIFALEFVNFIKLVNGVEGEENKTPVLHYKMLDAIAGPNMSIVNMLYRGSAKTTLMGEYLFLYLAVYGEIPGFGKVDIAIYVSDSIENGVKNMRKNLEYRWENSEFLQKYIPETRFTDVRYEFTNIAGKKLIVKGYGAKTGVRGAKEMGKRVDLALLDDLMSDEDARSATIIASIEDTVYKAIDYALHPKKSKTIWNGTPFNQNDPLYKAIESGAWDVSVYPVCEHFDEHTTEETFKGAWPDRHDFAYVKRQYEKAKLAGKLDSFMQELMLRITSDEDRLIRDNDIQWFEASHVENRMYNYNFYITTDFATSTKERADYSVISCWAYNSNMDWMLVDGQIGRNLMDKNINLLFDMVVKYDIKSVGVEVTGQQGAFVTWIRKEMHTRNIYFTIIEVRPTQDKLKRFHTVVPLFRQGKMWFNKDLIGTKFMTEMKNELDRATVSGFKSRHDDAIDTVSMLAEMKPWKPMSGSSKSSGGYDDPFYEDNDDDNNSQYGSYII
jgi:predicted phage terminase large subunit-like protein